MVSEAKKTFSYRISQANRTELIVILYDMALEYIKDAKAAKERADYQWNVRQAKRVVDRLCTVLDLQYEIALQLFRVYMNISRMLVRAGMDGQEALLDSVEKQLRTLRKAFYEVSKQDDSAPMMQNAQQVYAGLTYSNAGSSNEYSNDFASNRGLKA